MRFYSMDWWGGSDESDRGSEYLAYFERIRDRLTPALIALHEEADLHDSHLEALEVRTAESTATLKLRTATGREMEVTYAEVRDFTTRCHREIALPGPPGYGDLGYHELDIGEAGGFIHRILWSSGIEIEIAFGSLALRRARGL